ncbi:MAG: type II secretion system protein [Bdellovibrionales bacterium]|nr:type II secretion system protein [Bdellovibrionales bacterium]
MTGFHSFLKYLIPLFRGQSLKSSRGFTMIEVMVVLGIVAAIVVMVIPRIGNQNTEIKAAVRKMGVLAKECVNHSKLFGATHRIVIDLGDGFESNSQQSYWVEISTSPYLLPADKKDLFEKKDDDDEEEKKKFPFEMAARLTKEKKSLPGKLRFRSVEVAGLERPITTGIAYIHFFPQGLSEEAIIQLGVGDKLNWSILFHPLTGKTDIITKKMTLAEINK